MTAFQSKRHLYVPHNTLKWPHQFLWLALDHRYTSQWELRARAANPHTLIFIRESRVILEAFIAPLRDRTNQINSRYMLSWEKRHLVFRCVYLSTPLVFRQTTFAAAIFQPLPHTGIFPNLVFISTTSLEPETDSSTVSVAGHKHVYGKTNDYFINRTTNQPFWPKHFFELSEVLVNLFLWKLCDYFSQGRF